MPQEPASIRYKNPGAMWGRLGPRPSADTVVPTNAPIPLRWGSTDTVYLKDGMGQGNNIAVFPTYVQGICAQLDLWRSSAKYRNKTLADALHTWSGGNNTESYIKYVLQRIPGMTRNTVMDDAFWRSAQGLQFLKVQAGHEAGKPYPAPEADWVEAHRRVFSGAPVGPKPKDAPTPKKTKPLPPPDMPTKPVVQSKTAWSQIGIVASSIFGAMLDWKVAAVVVVGLLAAYAIWEIKKRPDIGGWIK